MTAANIAARKFFSKDTAIDQDDLVAIAALRILQRESTTIGAGVHVGREAIAKAIGERRYAQRSDNVSLGSVDVSKRFETPGIQNFVDRKKRAFARTIIGKVGKPDFRIGRFGVAYGAGAEHLLAGVWFEGRYDSRLLPRLPVDFSPGDDFRQRVLLVTGSMNDQVERLANYHYVVLLHGQDEKTNAAGLAGPKRESPVSQTGQRSDRQEPGICPGTLPVLAGLQDCCKAS